MTSSTDVLLIEGDALCRKNLRKRLEEQGYCVTVAASPEEGLAFLRSPKPRLVVADVGHPELCGLELSHQLNQEPHTSSLPVFLVSPEHCPTVHHRANELGAEVHWASRDSVDALLERIREHVEPSYLTGSLTPEQMHTTLNAIDGALWQVDPIKNSISYSPHWMARLGLKGQTSIGVEAWESRVHPDDLNEIRVARDLFDVSELYEVEYRIRDAEGIWMWCLSCGRVTETNEQGQSIRMRGYVRNITERKEVEEALWHQGRDREFILNNVTEVISHLNTEMRVVSTNRAGMRRAGLPHDAILGRKCYEVFHPGHGPCADCPSRRALATGEMEKGELQLDDGSSFLITAEPLLDRDERIIGVVESVLEITEYKKLQHQLLQTQKMQSIGELAGTMAHDFKNILQVVLGYGRLLENHVEGNEEAETFLREIIETAEHGREYIGRLLQVQHRGKPESFIPMAPSELLGEHFYRMIDNIVGAGVRLSITLDADLPAIRGNLSQLEQVLMNLCINARDAMDAKGDLTIHASCSHRHDPTISIPHRPDARDYICIAVRDTGCGIPQSNLDRIFEPFFTTKDQKGTGLGLVGVYTMIQSHGGFIDVDSVAGEGSELRVYLPAERWDTTPE